MGSYERYLDKALLNRGMNAEIATQIERLSLFADTCVEIAVQALSWCCDVRGGDECGVAVMLLRDICERLDAVSILIRCGSAESCPVLLRGGLEAYAAMAYMLKSDTPRRARAYRFCNYMNRRKFIERVEQMSATDQNPRTFSAEALEMSREQRGLVDAVLNDPGFADILEEYKRTKTKKNKIQYPEWFSLFDGPSSIRALIKEIGNQELYSLYYGQWSQVAHAIDAMNRCRLTNNGTLIQPLRYPESLQHWAMHVGLLAIPAAQAAVSHIAPHRFEELKGLYLLHVQGEMQFLAKNLLFTVSHARH